MLLIKNPSTRYLVEPLQSTKYHVGLRRPTSTMIDPSRPSVSSLSIKGDQSSVEYTQPVSVAGATKARRAEAVSSASELFSNSVLDSTTVSSSGPLSRTTVVGVVTGVTFGVLITLFVILMIFFRHRRNLSRRGLSRSIIKRTRRHYLESSESLTSFDTRTDSGGDGAQLDGQDEVLLPKTDQGIDGSERQKLWEFTPASITSTSLSLTSLSPSPAYSSQSRQPLISHTRSSSDTSRSFPRSIQSRLDTPFSSHSRGSPRSQSVSKLPTSFTPPQKSFSHSRSASDNSPSYQRRALSTIIDRSSDLPSPIVSPSLLPMHDSPHSLASLSNATSWLTPPLPSYKRRKQQVTITELPALSPTPYSLKTPANISNRSASPSSSFRLHLNSKPLPPLPPSLSPLTSWLPPLSIPETHLRSKYSDKPRQLRITRSEKTISSKFAKRATSEPKSKPFQELLSPGSHTYLRNMSSPYRRPIHSTSSQSTLNSRPLFELPCLLSPKPILTVDTHNDAQSAHLCPCSCTHSRNASKPRPCTHRRPTAFQSPCAHISSPALSVYETPLPTSSFAFSSKGSQPISPAANISTAVQAFSKPGGLLRPSQPEPTELHDTDIPIALFNSSYYVEASHTAEDNGDASSTAFSPLLRNAARNTKTKSTFEVTTPLRSPSISVPIMFSFPVQCSNKQRQMARAARVALQNGSIKLS